MRKSSALWRIQEQSGRITVHYCDIKDKEGLCTIFAKVKPDWLFHLATSRAPCDNFTDMFEENVLATGNLIAACLKFPHPDASKHHGDDTVPKVCGADWGGFHRGKGDGGGWLGWPQHPPPDGRSSLPSGTLSAPEDEPRIPADPEGDLQGSP